MKKLHKLTPEQRIFAEENHRLAECFIRRNSLERSEFYDVVIFGYLEAVQEYLEKPELSKYRFSSIAWIKMRESMLKEFDYLNRSKRKAVTQTYEEEYGCESQRDRVSNSMYIVETVDDRLHIRQLMPYMTAKEKEVVSMRAAGYTYREIAEVCNITIRGVSARLERMRHRLRMQALA